ncbi:putative 2-hydroxychromene-2-carboxylate isomerase [Aspergillus glaucus CBS 516.65]|uniref:Glutathione S-transferase kappa n=1 Tax=Aspergillus glaucus CBS 516.65 TaxID=1160497 RepID=A0A1L9VIW6_ASPGL|nr:hypothetical protein ASPGLDRAFT_150259 [Aspergillus glaucus CBS 516.65]OJJ83868.1 hypothetical protein ASPGLDRAFT_150259 [Aspergillus glaucus CBS 516.65]
MTSKITLYFDIVSPFAYIAFHALQNSPAFRNCTVSYVPIFLGGLMHSCGNTPPIKIKNKDIWINQERIRWSRYFRVPMVDHFPHDFPPVTLGVQRALCAVSQRYPELLVPAIASLYYAFWADGNSKVIQPEIFGPILEKVLGKERTHEIVKDSKTSDIKSLLNENTDRAFRSGAFGLPWFECTNPQGEMEGFWGIDHLGQVADFCELERRIEPGFRALL